LVSKLLLEFTKEKRRAKEDNRGKKIGKVCY